MGEEIDALTGNNVEESASNSTELNYAPSQGVGTYLGAKALPSPQ
jgi:hypothetical protein